MWFDDENMYRFFSSNWGFLQDLSESEDILVGWSTIIAFVDAVLCLLLTMFVILHIFKQHVFSFSRYT